MALSVIQFYRRALVSVPEAARTETRILLSIKKKAEKRVKKKIKNAATKELDARFSLFVFSCSGHSCS